MCDKQDLIRESIDAEKLTEPPPGARVCPDCGDVPTDLDFDPVLNRCMSCSCRENDENNERWAQRVLYLEDACANLGARNAILHRVMRFWKRSTFLCAATLVAMILLWGLS